LKTGSHGCNLNTAVEAEELVCGLALVVVYIDDVVLLPHNEKRRMMETGLETR
jgi:hypothetical protein